MNISDEYSDNLDEFEPDTFFDGGDGEDDDDFLLNGFTGEKTHKKVYAMISVAIVALVIIVIAGAGILFILGDASSSPSSKSTSSNAHVDHHIPDPVKGAKTEVFHTDPLVIDKHQQFMSEIPNVPQPLDGKSDIAIHKVRFDILDRFGRHVPNEQVYNHHVFIFNYDSLDEKGNVHGLNVLAGFGAEGVESPIEFPEPYAIIVSKDKQWGISHHLIDLWGLPATTKQTLILEYEVTYTELTSNDNDDKKARDTRSDRSYWKDIDFMLLGYGTHYDENHGGGSDDAGDLSVKRKRDDDDDGTSGSADNEDTELILSDLHEPEVSGVSNGEEDSDEKSHHDDISGVEFKVPGTGDLDSIFVKDFAFKWPFSDATLVLGLGHIHIGSLQCVLFDMNTQSLDDVSLLDEFPSGEEAKNDDDGYISFEDRTPIVNSFPIYDDYGFINKITRDWPIYHMKQNHVYAVTSVYANTFPYEEVMSLFQAYLHFTDTDNEAKRQLLTSKTNAFALHREPLSDEMIRAIRQSM